MPVTAQRSLAGPVAPVVLAVLLWWVPGDGDRAPDTGTDPGGLPAVALADLPPESGQALDLIDADGPYPTTRTTGYS